MHVRAGVCLLGGGGGQTVEEDELKLYACNPLSQSPQGPALMMPELTTKYNSERNMTPRHKLCYTHPRTNTHTPTEHIREIYKIK